MAHTAALIANFFIGHLEQAHELAGLISARYNPRVHGKLVQIYQHDPLIVALVYSGHIEWLLGRPPAAESAAMLRGGLRKRSDTLSCWHSRPFLVSATTGMKAILRPILPASSAA